MIWQLDPLDETDRVKLNTHNKSTNQQDKQNKQEEVVVMWPYCRAVANTYEGWLEKISKLGYPTWAGEIMAKILTWDFNHGLISPERARHIRYYVYYLLQETDSFLKIINEDDKSKAWNKWDLFGCHNLVPLRRVDCMGLCVGSFKVKLKVLMPEKNIIRVETHTKAYMTVPKIPHRNVDMITVDGFILRSKPLLYADNEGLSEDFVKKLPGDREINTKYLQEQLSIKESKSLDILRYLLDNNIVKQNYVGIFYLNEQRTNANENASTVSQAS